MTLETSAPLPGQTRITPASLGFDAAGTPVSSHFGDVYHAAEGGPGQARHVFLGGNALPQRWALRERFVILENGFGTGLNFLATWAAWRTDPQRCQRLHYLAVEKHPFQVEDLAQLHTHWPEFAPLAEALRTHWPVLTPGFHRVELDRGQVVLTLLLGDTERVLKQLQARVDAFYLDGFDPKKNPAMWSPSVSLRLAQLAAPEATLATWCVARAVRDALQAAGFITAKRPGYARKRDMLTGHIGARANSAPPALEHARHALILGGGIAGSALAQRLTARGWRVDLIERHPHLATAGSGNLAGIVRPLLSRDDNIPSRLNRACFLYAKRAWQTLEDAGFASRRALDGVLHLARDIHHETQQRDVLAQTSFPESFVQFLERDAASARIGWPTTLGGWWFPGGGWASPPTLCHALVAAAGNDLTCHLGRAVADLDWTGELWQARDADGTVIATAPIAILASGAEALPRGILHNLAITPARGQVSHLPAGSIPDIPHAVCCEGYLTPAVEGVHCMGASYAHDVETTLRAAEHKGNLARLTRILPGTGQTLEAARLQGRVGFRATTPDRLPLLGALPNDTLPRPRDVRLRDMPRQPGLYGLMGLGSRGLVWATLAAEALASQLQGDPLPLEVDLMEAVDPARFLLRAHRKPRKHL